MTKAPYGFQYCFVIKGYESWKELALFIILNVPHNKKWKASLIYQYTLSINFASFIIWVAALLE